MAGRVIRFAIADALETALVTATELDRDQLQQLQEHVAALLAALPPPPAIVVEPTRQRSPFLDGLPEGPRGGGSLEWKRIRQGQKVHGPYPLSPGPVGRTAAVDLPPRAGSGHP
jgi:hypothetical protein